MSIQTAIQNAQQRIANAYIAINNKGGTLPETQNLSNMPNAIISIPAGGLSAVITSLSITPTTSQQTITASGGVNGYAPITVSAVTSSIDANISAGNIKSGVSILGVNGSVIELKGETRSVSLTSSSGNTFTPSSGKNGITSITVTPNNQAKTITATTSSQTINVPSGYSGFGTITVNAVTSSIDNNITAANIKKDVTILGVTGSYEGSEGSDGIPRKVDAQGNYGVPMNNFTFSIPNNAVNIKESALYNALSGSRVTSIDLHSVQRIERLGIRNVCWECSQLASADLSGLTTLSGSQAMYAAFFQCSQLTSINISNLVTISGSQAMASALKGCSSLTSIDLSSLETVSGSGGMSSAFTDCSNLTSIDLSNLTTISGSEAMFTAFSNCYRLSSISFPALTTLSGSQAMYGAFSRCSALTSISFPALTSNSFGSYTNQFNYMLNYVKGCTVHFPSNLQSVIGSWSDVVAGFNGTNTVVLFDLPATT